MPGLLQRKMQPEMMEQEPEMSMEQETPNEREPEAHGRAPSSDAQNAYDRVIAAGMKVLYEDPTHEKILQMLKAGADNPPDVLAQVVAMILSALNTKAKGQIPKNVILPAAEELMALVAELAEKAGFFKADDEMIKTGLAQVIQMITQQEGVDKPQVESMLQKLGAKPESNPMQGGMGAMNQEAQPTEQ